jgi:hypothetical protein
MRPLYEHEGDIAREAKFLNWANKVTSAQKVVKLPPLYCVDFAAINPETMAIDAVIEFKARRIDMETIGTFHVSHKKVLALREIGVNFGVKVFFAILTPKGLYKLDAAAPCTIFYGGRTVKTRDSHDIEIMASFDTKFINLLSSEVTF